MIKRGGYRKKLRYRLGWWPHLPPKGSDKKRIWIQAVSVGELSSIQSLLQSFISDPKIEVVLSGTTSTGQKIAEEKYAKNVLAYGPFPLDWFPFSSLAWSRIQPDLAICVDSELWPEHMYQAKKREIPFFIVNARLSDRSFSRLSSMGIFQNLLIPHNLQILASSEKQRQRWIKIGLEDKKTFNTGNLKIDIAPYQPTITEKKNKKKEELGFPASSIVLVGISTWPGEEKILLECLEEIRDKKIDARLLLIPRHAERRESILENLNAFPFSFQQRTRPKENHKENLAYLADTTGELNELIQSADLAFLGKTLPPRHEGQNPIEPISIGLPLVIGPKCTNFSETCDELLHRGAVEQGNSPDEIKMIIIQLLQSETQREVMRNAGLKWRKEQGSPTLNAYKELQKYLA
ncbi:MAG: 3-deoxy-D-manno-octulosonic acid transferase [Opitutae bacterium]|jgi:3-deoxy-D-manno-octulosonic-acid transferase|nr:3-deoxy-D-manno-octulosonic acid transferase [Opitutae bacterium]MBT5717267.1 3-deoxy-D-manno-octulosonic acid transferase [Opitutae bacterium]